MPAAPRFSSFLINAASDTGYAHERRDSSGIRGAYEVTRAIEIERAVLHVDDDEIKTCRSHHLNDYRAAGEQQHAGDSPAFAQAFANSVLDCHDFCCKWFCDSEEPRGYRVLVGRVKAGALLDGLTARSHMLRHAAWRSCIVMLLTPFLFEENSCNG
jgi:hypothetical protein